MTYKELLNTLRNLHVPLIDLETAVTLDLTLTFNYSDTQFNELCDYVKEVYSHSSATLTEVAKCIDDLVVKKQLTVEEILKTDICDFISQVGKWSGW